MYLYLNKSLMVKKNRPRIFIIKKILHNLNVSASTLWNSMIFQSQLVPFTNIFFWYQLLVWQAVSNAISKIDIQWVNYHFYCARVLIAGTIMNWSKQIIYGLAQDSWNASALAIKLLQSCTKSSIWEWLYILCCQRFCKINVDKRYTYGHGIGITAVNHKSALSPI